jgi:glutathione S-transferase
MITLHHLNNSRSQRILWLLEELGVEYSLQVYKRDKKTQLAPKELASVHPLGKAPVITDNDTVVAESGAIIEYLVNQYGQSMRPEFGTREYQQYSYWMHFAEGSLMTPMLFSVVLNKVKSSPMPFFAKPIARAIVAKVMSVFVNPNLKRLMRFVDDHLADHQWFAGDVLSGADFQMSFPLEAALASGIVDRRYANIERFLRRISSRPAYQAALTKGGRYAYAAKSD